MNKIKIAKTKYKVHPLIKKRWSARSFSDKPITEEQVLTLIEAASWSFSSINEQPWRYIYGVKGSENFDKIFETLMPGNALWAKNAAAFVACIAKTTSDREGNPINHAAEMDLGSANMLLVLQALSMDIYAHPMGGFDRMKFASTFHLESNLKPAVVIALGYLDEADKLSEPFRERELMPRTRKSLSEIILN